MISLATARGVAMRALTLAAVLAALCTSLLYAQSGTADAAPRKACFGWSGSTPYKSLGMTLFRGHHDIEWCGVGNRVTEYRVLRCEAGEGRAAFVRIPRPTSGDCRQRQPLNGSSLRVYGDMWANATVTAAIRGVKFEGGRLNVHNELTLYPDGRITGSTGG